MSHRRSYAYVMSHHAARRCYLHAHVRMRPTYVLQIARFTLQEARAKLLVKSVPAARRLGLARVRDILWMYTGRDVYRMLVLERGWSSDEYESWLAETLIKALMG